MHSITSREKWDQAIAEAKAEIQKAEKHIRGLRTAIEILERDRDAGKQWTQPATQN